MSLIRTLLKGSTRFSTFASSLTLSLGLLAAPVQALDNTVYVPLQPNYHLTKGVEALKSGNYARAVDQFEQALKNRLSDQVQSMAYTNICAAKFKLDNHKDAITACKKAIKIDPSTWIAHKNLGVIYLAAGEVEKAQDALIRAQRLNKKDKGTTLLIKQAGDAIAAKNYALK